MSKTIFTAKARCLAVAGTLLLAICFSTSCSKQIEVKSDTPQATVSTMIKAFDAQKPELVEPLVDPVVGRMEAREAACAGEVARLAHCAEETTKAMHAFGQGRTWLWEDEECKSWNTLLSECRCGERGEDAARDAQVHRSSRAVEWLRGAELSAESCRIADSRELQIPSTEQGRQSPEAAALRRAFFDAFDDFGELACSDIPTPEAERFAFVDVRCAQSAQLIKLVLRQSGASWRMLGLQSETKARMLADQFEAAARSAQQSVEATQAAKEAELNRDLNP